MLNYTDHEFETRFELFAAMCGDDYFPWRRMRARKEHVDEFGKMISQDETYFRKEVFAGHEKALKMSKASMDSFLFVLFAGNRHLLEIAIREAQEKKKRQRAAIDEAAKIINQFRKGLVAIWWPPICHLFVIYRCHLLTRDRGESLGDLCCSKRMRVTLIGSSGWGCGINPVTSYLHWNSEIAVGACPAAGHKGV